MGFRGFDVVVLLKRHHVDYEVDEVPQRQVAIQIPMMMSVIVDTNQVHLIWTATFRPLVNHKVPARRLKKNFNSLCPFRRVSSSGCC